MEPKVGDIYRWKWNSEALEQLQDKVSAIYWCCSCICVFRDDEKFWDTFWGGSDYIHDKRFTLDEASERLNLEYIGNFDDLIEARKEDRAYYEDKDCVDISHSNRTRGGFYIRKGAVKSIDKMCRIMNRNIKKLQYEADYATRRVEDMKNALKKLSIESHLPIIDDVALTDSSYEDDEI